MLVNPYIGPPEYREEVLKAEMRAHQASAPEALEYVGIGMYGIVFCDKNNVAWKVFRHQDAAPEDILRFLRVVLAEEYEWLRDAAETLIVGSVAQAYAMYPDEIVLKRECIRGYPGTWAKSRELRILHGKIEKAMIPKGWTAPEFKEDSYVYESEDRPRLVDISHAQRIGMNLAGFVDDVLEGRRETYKRPRDLAFFIIREWPYKTIPEEVTRDLLARLIELDPEIVEAFTLPRELGLAGSRNG
jgi:hypothetical protein